MTAPAAALNPRMDSVEFLFHGSETMRKEFIGLPILLFAEILDLISHVIGNIGLVDRFVLVVPGDCLEHLLDDVVYKFSQTWQIYVYYEDVSQMKPDEERFKNNYNKLRFCHKRNLKARLQQFQVDTATRSSGLNYQATVNDSASSCEKRLSGKRPNIGTGYSPVPNRIDQKQSNQNNSTGKNDTVVRGVYVQQVDQSRLRGGSAHTTESAEHIIRTIPFISTSMHLSDTGTTIDNQEQFVSNHLLEVMHTLSDRVNIVSNEQQRVAIEFQSITTSLQTVDQNFFSIQASHQDFLIQVSAISLTQDLLRQEIWSLEQTVSDALSTSFDGSYIWRITGVHEKIVDARSERQKSIYSPPFYSSKTGYKLCLRLYLNGDADMRGEYLSLFIVLMKNEYDALLIWPFPFPIVFRLISQSTSDGNQHDVIRCLRPDVQPHRFQRPMMNMNEAFGIKEFLSIGEFEKNERCFIKGDTIFIEAKIDFMNENASIPSWTGGFPNDAGHVGGIDEECMRSY